MFRSVWVPGFFPLVTQHCCAGDHRKSAGRPCRGARKTWRQNMYRLYPVRGASKVVNQSTNIWWFKVPFLVGWLSDPFKGLSDLQLGDEKVTLNHLVICFQDVMQYSCNDFELLNKSWIFVCFCLTEDNPYWLKSLTIGSFIEGVIFPKLALHVNLEVPNVARNRRIQLLWVFHGVYWGESYPNLQPGKRTFLR